MLGQFFGHFRQTLALIHSALDAEQGSLDGLLPPFSPFGGDDQFLVGELERGKAFQRGAGISAVVQHHGADVD